MATEVAAGYRHVTGVPARGIHGAARVLLGAGMVLLLATWAACATADSQSDVFSDAMQPFSPGPPAAEEKPTPEPSPEKPSPEKPPETEQAPEGTEQPQKPPGPQPEGPPGPPTSPRPETSGTQAPADSEQISLKANEVYYTGQGTQAWGSVDVKYQDYEATADILGIDKERVWLDLRGDVVIKSSDMVTTADKLELNLDTEHWHASNTRTTVQPEFFQTGVVEPLYLEGRHIHGRPGLMDMTSGYGTSCDLPDHQHYMLRSSQIKVLPDRYVSFHRPTLYLFGHRILRYPWDLRLSLSERTNAFVPAVGQNDAEGYFAKFAYMYLLNEANSGVLRLHLTQKRGTGLGFDHDFDLGSNYGDLRFFSEPSEGSWSGRLSDRQYFSDSVTADLISNVQSYTAYGTDSKSMSNSLTFNSRTGTSQSVLGLQEANTKTVYNENTRRTVNLTHRQQASENYNWEVRSTMQSSRYSATQPANEELNAEIRLRGRETAYNWEAVTQKRYDLDGSKYTADDSYYSLDYLPELTAQTDTERLGGYRLLGRARVQASLNLGRYSQQPEGLDVSRAALDISLPGRREDIGGGHMMQNSLRFQQQFTSEGSAQYYANLRSDLQGNLGDTWSYRWNYNFGSPHGYTPLRRGYSSRSNSMGLQLVRVVPDSMRLDLSTGYDFVYDYYRDATFRGQFMLARDSRLELQTSYSILRSQWRPITARWLRASTGWYSALTAYYDLDQNKLRRASSEINWRLSDQWNLDIAAGYSGYTHKLDQLEIQVLRDLHCMITSVTYNKELNEFRFNIGIKAFPSDERQFGVGAGGAQFESTFGQYY